jgi:hypothetical protein
MRSQPGGVSTLKPVARVYPATPRARAPRFRPVLFIIAASAALWGLIGAGVWALVAG